MNPETIAKAKAYASTAWTWLQKPLPAWACVVAFVVGWVIG